ncbi:LysR family transcriptional regulator [Asticcacaulis solisilvae]|uniref:LysR family transcriptional regulator n=1 Tax=Asticcacaulis solisilvae TaxID=1217274 RepID=UPI003FD6C2D7
MNFQQLRFVREAVRRDFNLTEVGNALFMSQSGVSKRIRELEDELGVDIFVRKGKRITGLTTAGLHLIPKVERILDEAEALRRCARGHLGAAQGPGFDHVNELGLQ